MGLDRLGQEEYTEGGHPVAEFDRRHRALVCVRRGHPDVDDRNVRKVPIDGRDQVVGVGNGLADLDAGLCEQPGKAFPDQGRVVRDDYPHGSTASTRVPPPGRSSAESVPPRAATRSASPCSPRP